MTDITHNIKQKKQEQIKINKQDRMGKGSDQD